MDRTESVDSFKEEYRSYTMRRIALIVVFSVITVLLFFFSLTVGTRSLSMSEVYGYFLDYFKGITYDQSTQYALWYDYRIVWNYRVPRALFAILAGAALSVAGAAMQNVMKNPLADPYTTGISSGALLGVAVAMVAGLTVGSGSAYGTGAAINAMIFAMIPVAVIYLMSPYFRSPATLILAGTAISYLFSSLTSILLVSTDEETLASVYQWQVGTFSDVSWDSIPLVLIACVVGVSILMFLSGKLNLMTLDDNNAKALGLNVERLRLVCLIVLSFMTAAVISFVGVVGFVGLIIPHMVRLLIGSDNRFVIPASVFVGATFLLACDIISRAIDVSATIPVGVVTAFIGSPIFLYLIVRNRRGIWRWPRSSSGRGSRPTAPGGAGGPSGCSC